MSGTERTARQAALAIRAALAIPVDDLELLVQEAHESTPKQMHDPQERFPVSRQALRMFWYFRRNLEAVNVFTETPARG